MITEIQKIWDELDGVSNSELFFEVGCFYRIGTLHMSKVGVYQHTVEEWENLRDRFRVRLHRYDGMGECLGEPSLLFIGKDNITTEGQQRGYWALTPKFIEDKMFELGLTFEDLLEKTLS